MTQDAFAEALELHARASTSDERPEDFERLCALAPHIEEALQDERDDERYARGALALTKPFAAQGRAHELDTYLRSALRRAQTKTTRAQAAITLGHYLFMYHLFQESVDLLELHPPEDEDVDSCISHAYTLSLALRALNQWERACEVLERGLRLARLYAHTRGHCMLLHVFGGLELYRGDYAAALARWDEVECLCRDRLRARQDDMLEIIALGQGLALAGLRKYDEAIATLRRVGRRAEETGDKDQRWYAHSNLTYITLYTGDTATASRMLQESLERYEASNHSSGLLTYHEQRFLLDLLVSGTHAPTPSLLFRETQTRADSNVSTRAQLYRCILDRTLEDFPEWPINEVISEQVWSLLRARLEGKEAELASGAPSVHAIERALLSLLQDTPTLWSREDFASISVDDQDTWIDLKSRPIARSILRQLAASAPRPVNSWHLLESTWPDIIVRDATALNRLYTNIHRLRAMGLQDVLIREGDGYRLTRCKAV